MLGAIQTCPAKIFTKSYCFLQKPLQKFATRYSVQIMYTITINTVFIL